MALDGPKHRRTSANRLTGLEVALTVEHVFATEKRRMGLVIRCIGLVRATARITLANLAYNMRRLAWLDGRAAAA